MKLFLLQLQTVRRKIKTRIINSDLVNRNKESEILWDTNLSLESSRAIQYHLTRVNRILFRKDTARFAISSPVKNLTGLVLTSVFNLWSMAEKETVSQ